MRNLFGSLLLFSLTFLVNSPVETCAMGQAVSSVADAAKEIWGPLVATASDVAKAEHGHWIEERDMLYKTKVTICRKWYFLVEIIFENQILDFK